MSGEAPFAAEFPIDGMVYAALAYSTIAKGRIATLDTSAAEAAPGVVLVMTHRNAPRMQPPPLFLTAAKAAGGDDLPVMQDDRIHWNGQPIAVVLAETQEQADHAKSLIRVTYEAEEALTAFARGEGAKAPSRACSWASRCRTRSAMRRRRWRPRRSRSMRPTARRATTTTPSSSHAVTVAWQGDTLRIHDASQLVAHTAWSIAQVFGIDEEQVRVTSPFVGGGFGGKMPVAASGAGRGGGEAGWAAGAARAVARGRLPHGRRAHA